MADNKNVVDKKVVEKEQESAPWWLWVLLAGIVFMIVACILTTRAFTTVFAPEESEKTTEEAIGDEEDQEVVSQDGLIVQIDGYGSQQGYGDPLVGRKIVVRDDLEANENGWFTREVYEVTSLEELNIDDLDVDVPFLVEYERDYSQARRAWQPYYAMNVDATVSAKQIEDFLSENSQIVPTSVVLRIDNNGEKQECSLRGLDPLAVRYVLYVGDGITFQTCDPNWENPN
jgi:hypothetical protein